MKRYRRLLKKLSALALVFVMTLALAQPVYSFAEEGTVTDETVNKTSDESGADAVNQKQETQGDISAKQNENSAEDANNEESGSNIISDNSSENQGNLPDSEIEEKENNSSENNADTGSMEQPALDQATGKQVDLTKPVIEKVEFLQNEKTLKDGDTVEFHVYAYDADSGIESVCVDLASENSGYFGSKDLTYDETKKCYVGTWKLENTIAGKIYVSSIKVVDQNGNYATADVYENDAYDQYKYWFIVDKKDEIISVANFNFPQNGETVTRNDISQIANDMKIELETSIKDEQIWAHFSTKDEDYKEFTLIRDDSGKIFTQGDYFGGSSDLGEQDREYILDYFYVERFGGRLQFQINDSGNYKFTVKGEKDDVTAPVITSIELDKNRKPVHAGDKVNITVKATDDKGLAAYGYANFSAAADIDSRWELVTLTYSEDDDAYHGVFEIDEGRYPCEWYLSSLDIYDKADHVADITKFNPAFYQTYPYYVNVYNGDTFVDPAMDTNIHFITQNQYGLWLPTTVIKKEKIGRRTTLKDMGIALPEMKAAVNGLNQIGWIDENGNPVTESSELCNNGYISIYAQYDKNAAEISYSYIDQNENWQFEKRMQIFEKGTTYRELFETVRAYAPANMTDKYTFERWELQAYNIDEDSVIPDAGQYANFNCTAKYSGVKFMHIERNYYDSQGCFATSDKSEMLIINDNMTGKDVLEMLKNQKTPEMYKGLRFKGWNYNINNDSEIRNGQTIYIEAEYENLIIRYCIDPIFGKESISGDWDEHKFETIICQLAEVGDKVTIPKSFDGYDSVTWRFRPVETDTFTVERNLTFLGYGKKSAGEESGEPVEPEEPVQPDKPDNTEHGNKLPDSTIESIVEIIKEVKTGETVQIDMGDATVVPKDILEAAKGKDVNVTLNMGGYSWTINGNDIMASNLEDINLEVKFDTNQIPNKVIAELAGGNPTKQISLTHNGDFGFKATLTMNVGTEYADKYGNLYYYDSDGKMVFMNAGKINKDGTVSLQFSHASDYVLVMSEQQMSQNDVPETLQPKTVIATDTKKSEGVKTGDNLPVVPLAAMMMAAALMVIISIRLKSKNR